MIKKEKLKQKKLMDGIILCASGSLWWGVIGVIYFKHFAFVGPLELVVHRIFWTTVMLFLTTTIYSKWNVFNKAILDLKKMLILFISGMLIFINWSVWIYAVATDKIIDASFGYFIFPILSVFFGFLFFKEKLNTMRLISIILVIISLIYLLFNFKSFPWIGLTVALSWSIYNLLRKKIKIDADIGLLIESIYVLPFSIVIFYFIVQNNLNDFSFTNPSLMFLLILAGPMTVIPLFLYIRGVALSGLGPSGMIFFITPTGQFLLGFFYYNELFTFDKLISFILIWIAVIIYLKDLNQKNNA